MNRDLLITLINEDYSTHQIASKINCGQTNVRFWLKKFGLKTKKITSNKSLKTCRYCGGMLKKIKNLYCSSECRSKKFEQETKLKLLNGQLLRQSSVRKAFLLLNEYKCNICHSTEWMGKKIPLILDHIDGHSRNNHISNLRLVCCNCDALLPTYKNKNKGNGRAYRMERYRLGLSY